MRGVHEPCAEPPDCWSQDREQLRAATVSDRWTIAILGSTQLQQPLVIARRRAGHASSPWHGAEKKAQAFQWLQLLHRGHDHTDEGEGMPRTSSAGMAPYCKRVSHGAGEDRKPNGFLRSTRTSSHGVQGGQAVVNALFEAGANNNV